MLQYKKRLCNMYTWATEKDTTKKEQTKYGKLNKEPSKSKSQEN